MEDKDFKLELDELGVRLSPKISLKDKEEEKNKAIKRKLNQSTLFNFLIEDKFLDGIIDSMLEFSTYCCNVEYKQEDKKTLNKIFGEHNRKEIDILIKMIDRERKISIEEGAPTKWDYKISQDSSSYYTLNDGKNKICSRIVIIENDYFTMKFTFQDH